MCTTDKRCLQVNGSAEEFVAKMDKPDWDTFFMSLAFLYCTRSPDQQTKAGCVIVDWPSKLPIGLGYNGHPRGVNDLPTLREGSAKTHFTGNDDKIYLTGQSVPKDVMPKFCYNKEEVGDWIQQSPDKYPSMIHADMNAITNLWRPSDYAVGYLPFEPCENCFLCWLSKSGVVFRRIVILSSRPMQNFYRILEKWNEAHDTKPISVDVIGNRVKASRDNEAFKHHHKGAENDPAYTLLQAARYCNLMIENSKGLSANSSTVYRKNPVE